MAIYARDFYGLAKYGSDSYVDLQVDPFVAQPNGYNSIRLTWAVPNGSWLRLRVLRSVSGYAVNENDGLVLLDTDISLKDFTDSVPGGQFYYYTLFLQVDADPSKGIPAGWHRVAVVTGLSVSDNGFNQILWDAVPPYFHYLDHQPDGQVLSSYDVRAFSIDSDDNEVNTYLVKFLSIFGWGMSYLDTYAKTLLNANVPDAMHLENLSRMAQEMGIDYQYEVPARIMRRHVANQALLSRSRGTLQGLREEVVANTGWDVEFEFSDNQFLGQDQANFLNPQFPAWDPAVNYPAPTPSPNLIPNPGFEDNSYGHLSVFNVGTSGSTMYRTGAHHSGTYSLIVGGAGGLVVHSDAHGTPFPVQVGTEYTFSAWVNSGFYASTDARVYINWLAADASVIHQDGYNNTYSFAASTWTQMSVTAYAPVNAATALLYVSVLDAGSPGLFEIIYYDDFSFQANGASQVVWFNGDLFENKVTAYGNAQKPNADGTENTWWRPYSQTVDISALSQRTGYINPWTKIHSPAVLPWYGVPEDISLELGVSPSSVELMRPDVTNSNALSVVNDATFPVNYSAYGVASVYDRMAPITEGIPIPVGTAWNATTNYTKGDLVRFHGRLYRALRRNVGRDPNDFINDWKFVNADGVPPLTLSCYTHMAYGETPGVPVSVFNAQFDEYGRLAVPFGYVLDPSVETLYIRQAPGNAGLVFASGMYDTFNNKLGHIGTIGSWRVPTSHQVGGNTWQVKSGDWVIADTSADDDLVAAPFGRGTLAYNHTFTGGFRFATTMVSDAITGSTQGLAVNYVDDDNCILVGRTNVYQISGGVKTVIGALSTPITDGERAIIEYIGTSLKVYKEDDSVDTFTVPSQTSTWLALMVVPS